MSIEKKPSRWVQSLLLSAIRLHLNRITTFKVTQNDTKDLQPPYLIVSNHVNNWDPLYINLFVDEPISFIAGEPLFRNPLLKKILEYTGAIRKTKFKSDTSTIRNVMKAKKHNRVIGLFPEGNRNWDGVTEPIIYSTAKLVKLLKIPVVAVQIKGGHLTHPRWGDGDRKGTIEISLQKIWDGEDVTDLSVSAIHHQLSESLHHDEMNWQMDKGYSYRGKNIAHYLERLLFTCPSCHKISHMRSDHDTFRCDNCDYQVQFTEQGFFHSDDTLYFDTPYKWKQWQQHHLNQLVATADNLPEIEDQIELYQSRGQQPFEKVMKGTILLKREQISINARNGRNQSFPFEQMEGINIHFHHKLDFFIEDTLYRVIFTNPRASAYMWLQLIQRLKASTVVKEQLS
ncbi:lysophospholipid acyltransferase family protein [Gracilibacillus sp. D59]|uniref:lysophospholipid acyltransferase family protein n=1 Tax=Gracilibacillus sp. D59 TaxID=3457434 RepID=UPI003FCEAB8B